jgi:Methylamine utilisation protein MauE
MSILVWRPMAATAAVTFVSLLFTHAAFNKLMDWSAFTGYLADYRIIPDRASPYVSRLLIVGELLVPLTLVSGHRRFGALLGIALLALYATSIAINLQRGRSHIECGCGGAGQPIAWSLVLRNALLSAIAGLALLTSSSPRVPNELMTAVLGGFCLWLSFMVIEQVVINAGHVRLSHPRSTL